LNTVKTEDITIDFGVVNSQVDTHPSSLDDDPDKHESDDEPNFKEEKKPTPKPHIPLHKYNNESEICVYPWVCECPRCLEDETR